MVMIQNANGIDSNNTLKAPLMLIAESPVEQKFSWFFVVFRGFGLDSPDRHTNT
jgi:hypothetical protein